jgi:crossover junction endodeoxyribonuclease RuvC
MGKYGETMKILGIDPGYATLGWGIIEQKGSSFYPVAYGAIFTKADEPMEKRLQIIYNSLGAIIDEYQPDGMSVEELFFNTNTKTAILVSQARGVIILAAAEKSVPFYEYTPLQIKQALVGYGRADKNQVQQMVKRILSLDTIPKPDDTADALAAAVCHCNSWR